MKKQILILAMSLIALVGVAKDLKTLYVTTEPKMDCPNCEAKIKKYIRFEKGVHNIKTDLGCQIVTIVYDAEKTDTVKIAKAFEKIKYQIKSVPDSQVDDCCKVGK